MRDWTGTGWGDCKTEEEIEERRDWLRERFIAGQEASAREDVEREQRLKQAERDGKEVDGDGFEYTEQKKHDHRTFAVRAFVDAEPVALVRWDEALGRLWDRVMRQIFAHQSKHGCLPKTGELQKWLVIWKQSHPEVAELPSGHPRTGVGGKRGVRRILEGAGNRGQ